MKKIGAIWLLILCVALPHAVAQEPARPVLHEDLWPVVVMMLGEEDDGAIQGILLIVVNKSSGKALKVTMDQDLFALDGLNLRQPDAMADALQTMQTRLQVPLEHYVSIDAKALDSLQPGAAKEKGILDLIGLGISMLGCVQTNLSILDAVSVFKTAFSQKGGAREMMLPQDSLDWGALRETLNGALSALSSS